jgi:hypothetical protein
VTDSADTWWRIAAAAPKARVVVRSLFRAVAAGTVPSSVVDGVRVVRITDVEAWRATRAARKPQPAAPAALPDLAADAPVPGFAYTIPPSQEVAESPPAMAPAAMAAAGGSPVGSASPLTLDAPASGPAEIARDKAITNLEEAVACYAAEVAAALRAAASADNMASSALFGVGDLKRERLPDRLAQVERRLVEIEKCLRMVLYGG